MEGSRCSLLFLEGTIHLSFLDKLIGCKLTRFLFIFILFLCQTLVSELPYKILRTTQQIRGWIVSEAMFPFFPHKINEYLSLKSKNIFEIERITIR